MSVWCWRVILQVFRRADELPLPLDARAVELHLDLEIRFGFGFIHPHICACMVDDACAIGVRGTAVIVLVMGVTLQIIAGREA